jgi:hypothetical protein
MSAKKGKRWRSAIPVLPAWLRVNAGMTDDDVAIVDKPLIRMTTMTWSSRRPLVGLCDRAQ